MVTGPWYHLDGDAAPCARREGANVAFLFPGPVLVLVQRDSVRNTGIKLGASLSVEEATAAQARYDEAVKLKNTLYAVVSTMTRRAS